MMPKVAVKHTAEHALLSSYSNTSFATAQRLAILACVISLAMFTSSCGTMAQATGAGERQSLHTLNLSGNLPGAAVSQSYNAVLAVGGGTSPYHFSVKTGSLPPGVILNPATGSFSGKPTAPGNYSFEVLVTDSPRLDEGGQTFSISVGGGSFGGGGTVKISVTPASTTLLSSQQQQFAATVSGTSNTAVIWLASTGTITPNGLFTAPAVTSLTSATVTAVSHAEPSKSASSIVSIEPPTNKALQITTSALPQGQQGNSYSEVFSATGGNAPYTWSISAGVTPSGITMSANGDLVGMPTAPGNFSFTVMVTDASRKTATETFSMTVTTGGNFDGPAELPRVTVPSAMSDTPAPGAVINVNAGGDLQAAMNSAHCGDIIQLQAGATFSGKFTVPAKNCDINHWIIIRTSAPDSALPAEGQRATPCYAGVASLPGRPAYNCSSPKNVMAKVQMVNHDDGPFQFADGAGFYRFVGLEVTRAIGAPSEAVLFTPQGRADHLVFDRMWMHGQAQDETHNGVALSGTTNVAVVDSYFNDFKCVAGTGQCTDAHAIAGGVGNTQDGPYKIQNNFLEASGESVMFGGGAATMTPTDITIVNNHFWKPWQWMQGNHPFVGGSTGHPFVVKNHLELKNAVRVLIEANLMENSWGGFSQSGFGILLTPKNQHTPRGTNVCPICQVTDVTIRYTHISHAGGGIQMATALSGGGKESGAPALAGARWSIHDVVIDDLSTKYVGGGSAFELLNDWAKNPLNNITINHVTAFPDSGSHLMTIGNLRNNASMYALVFTNNMVITGQFPVWNTGGGSENCAYNDVPLTSIDKCFPNNIFQNNALVATPPNFPPSSWPTNNMFPQTVDHVGFINFNDGNSGNYELQQSSPYKGKGTDGKDIGADIVGLNDALATVE